MKWITLSYRINIKVKTKDTRNNGLFYVFNRTSLNILISCGNIPSLKDNFFN